MIIRDITAADQSAWDALYNAYAQFYEVRQTPEMRATVWNWLIDPCHEVNGLVADRDGILVGFAHTRVFARPLAAASGVFLDDLFVAEFARGMGVAGALIATIKTQADKNGHSVVRWITAKENARARGLYDKVAEATDWVTYDLTA